MSSDELKMSDVRQIQARFPQISLLAPRNSKPNSIARLGTVSLYLIIESLNCLLFCAKTKDVKKNKEIMYLNILAIFLNIRIR